MVLDELIEQLHEIRRATPGDTVVVLEDECCGCSNSLQGLMLVDDRVREVLGKEVLEPAAVVLEG